MSRSTDILNTYVSDLLALEKHLYEAFDRQATDTNVLDYPQAKPIIDRLHRGAKTHVDALEVHLQALGGHPASTVKEAVTTMLGMAAGMLDRVRAYPVSKMLRDDYTALSMAAISYTMLHTTALALKEAPTAELARKHLQDLTPAIVEISEVIPFVVVKELERDTLAIDANVASEALRNTHAAWTRESLDTAA
jgi:ferritin-like metal-binding protein YciE